MRWVALSLVACACAGPAPAKGGHEHSRRVVIARIAEPLDSNAFSDVSRALLLPSGPREDGGVMAPASLEEARARYQDALEQIGDGTNYEKVSMMLRRGYQLSGNPKMLYNLGMIAGQLGQEPIAHACLETYLERMDPPPERLKEVRAELARLDAKTGWIAVRCDASVEGATIDEVDVTQPGPCPFARRVRVRVGEHLVTARAAGVHSSEKVTVTPGRTAGVDLRVE